MINAKCSKCGADLIMHEGYGVCSNCGEIIGFDVEDETKEIVEEIAEEVEAATEIVEENTYEPEVVTEEQEVPREDVTQAILQETEETETVEEKEESIVNDFPEEFDFPKRRKAPIIILIVFLLCIVAVFGGYFISRVDWGMFNNDAENAIPEEEIIEEVVEEQEEPEIAEEPEVVIEETEEEIEEPEETQVQQEPKKEETKPEPAPAPIKQEKPKEETVKKEEAVISPTPSISYRIRKTADDSSTQIGAFSDLERAKAFATAHAADGYKVFDMDGQLVFEP